MSIVEKDRERKRVFVRANSLLIKCNNKISVGVSASLEEKETRVLALALTLALFLYPERDLNPHNPKVTGF